MNKHDWRCDVCHRFIHEGATRHLHCQMDVEAKQRRTADLMRRVDEQLARDEKFIREFDR